jgi:hypothetical protein
MRYAVDDNRKDKGVIDAYMIGKSKITMITVIKRDLNNQEGFFSDLGRILVFKKDVHHRSFEEKKKYLKNKHTSKTEFKKVLELLKKQISQFENQLNEVQ